jgi:hypothetical protein
VRVVPDLAGVAEGGVSKTIDAPYAPGNRGLWRKAKSLNRQEFVVVGWSDPEGTRPHLGALLLGYYTNDGKLIYAGAWAQGCPTGRCQGNGGSSTCSATAISRAAIYAARGAPLGQGNRASLLVDLPRDEMALLIELVVHLGVN